MSSAAVSRPGSWSVITRPSSPGSVPGSRALSSSTVWNPVADMVLVVPKAPGGGSADGAGREDGVDAEGLVGHLAHPQADRDAGQRQRVGPADPVQRAEQVEHRV